MLIKNCGSDMSHIPSQKQFFLQSCRDYSSYFIFIASERASVDPVVIILLSMFVCFILKSHLRATLSCLKRQFTFELFFRITFTFSEEM